ncbi:MAG: MmcQ/YjbR family DNA-binding protein [Bacteroidetes bacterium]|nr:MAG: MmcQ/YjbR family DNA-binding protein [Bacteroidota bacterium]
MNIEDYRNFCLGLPGVTEDFPFDKETLVYKVMGKMFALTDVDTFGSFNAKCKPEDCIDLREQYSGIKPGYHMSKKHWNTISTDGSVPDELMYELIRNSYDLVVAGLTKKAREELREL